jgi:hypothetical protein
MRARTHMGDRLRIAALALPLIVAIGCAHKPATVDPPPPPPPPRVKLAVLKVESDQFPDVAKALNNQLREVQIKGVDDYFLSKVTLEVVQLSIECVEQTPACYQAVGRSLSAQKLLMAQISAGPTPRRGKRKDRVPSVGLVVTLFDVEGGEPIQRIEHSFKNENEAVQGAAEVVTAAAGPAKTAPASSPPPQARAGK